MTPCILLLAFKICRTQDYSPAAPTAMAFTVVIQCLCPRASLSLLQRQLEQDLSQSLPGAAQPLVNCFVCLSKSSIPEIGAAALEGWGCARYLRVGSAANAALSACWQPGASAAARRTPSTPHPRGTASFPTRSRSPSWPWPRLSAAPQARASQPWLRRCL